ncbi:MAG: RtcB family protein [Phycisphaerales bacterium]
MDTEERGDGRIVVGGEGAAGGALLHDERIAMWLADRLSAETARALLRLQCLADLRRMAVMPDVHPSRSVCVGCVIGTQEVVYPEAIGGDIGCGMSAVRVQGLSVGDLDGTSAGLVLRALAARVDVMARSARSVDLDDTGPGHAQLRTPGLAKLAGRLGETQLGTLGRGNHFVEVQADESGEVWIMVHSGSRGMGQAVASHYGRVAQQQGVRSVLAGLRLDGAAGQDYLADQGWCVRYAAANRRALLKAAGGALRAVAGARPDWGSFLDAPHNFLAMESHGGVVLAVHRKGAAPAHSGRAGLIPGSSGTLSVHVEGRGDARALCSSSHGAGRVLSRGDARRAITLTALRRQMGRVVYDERRADGLRDEAPGAYRDLREVMRAQRDLVRVVRTLTPLVSFKAGG